MPIAPVSHIGIVGCGQLSRMLALAGLPMGMRFSFLAEESESVQCISSDKSGFGHIVRMVGGADQQAAAELYEALGQPEVITVERESVPVPLLRELKAFCPVYPDPDIVWTIQNRHREKTLVAEVGLPTSPWVRIENNDSVVEAIKILGGYPVVIKSTEDGYDGYNQWVVDTEAELDNFEQARTASLQALAETGEGISEWIVEKKIPFDREISAIGARNAKGEVVCYTPGENRHQRGILKASMVPAPALLPVLEEKAEVYISTLLEKTGYVGVLAVECFVVGDELIINELAPRVHNSGHWSMDGAQTCQFENHLRAITNLPLGATTLKGVAGMVNLLGLRLCDDTTAPTALIQPKTHLHWYGKSSRLGRKLGHVNILCDSEEELMALIEATEHAYS